MIRQRNIDPVSALGIVEFIVPTAVSAAAVAAQAYLGTMVPLVDKVQLIDLTVAVDIVVVGGGTLTFNIGKSAANLRSNNAGTVVKAAVLTGVSAVGLYVADLTAIPPIDPRGLLPAQPNTFWLQPGWVNSGGTVTTVTFGYKLRYRPFSVTKDS